MIAPADRIAIARSEYQALDSYLQGLPPEGWARASACEGWQVRDVVAHLIGTTDFQAAMIQRALKGEPEPPLDVKGTTVRSRSEAIARQAIGLRERLTPDLLTPFVEHYRQLFDLLEEALSSFAVSGSAPPDTAAEPVLADGGVESAPAEGASGQ
ncbi:MAG: maleylpyruvate isomerase family mycothiol-dependent enzyme [Chloroflexi bacterium]|nr:maleylpyruvate isomerase family mycothiol-dependent enzyme [Chloroflexota bacterium]